MDGAISLRQNSRKEKSMSRLDDAISQMAYILDSLMALRNIQECGCCNDCRVSAVCPYKPQIGQMVRYNCPFWEGEQP